MTGVAQQAALLDSTPRNFNSCYNSGRSMNIAIAALTGKSAFAFSLADAPLNKRSAGDSTAFPRRFCTAAGRGGERAANGV